VDVVDALIGQRTAAASEQTGVALLRTSLDAARTQAAALLEALPAPPPSLEPNLGARVDRYA
jgi:hypothetical protein